MRIAFPIKMDAGMDSLLDEHFGAAELFLIVDTITGRLETRENRKLSGETSCKTGIFTAADKVDAVVTKCMGDGSQRNLAKTDIKIFQARSETVAENLALMDKDQLKPFHVFDFCRTHKNKKEGECGRH